VSTNMNRLARRATVVAFATACGLGATGARAQDNDVTLYAGYAFLKSDGGNLNGVRLSPEFKVNRVGSVVADLSYEKGSDASSKTSLTTYLGGVRVGVNVGGARVFAHALAGGARTSESVTPVSGVSISATETSLGLDGGGGVEFKLTGRFKLRAGADYFRRRINVGGGKKENQNDVRATVGVVF